MSPSPDFWLWLLALGLIAVGVAGTILPVLPGLPVVFAGMVLAAWIDDFERVGYVSLAILGAITLLSIVVDLLSGVLGARRFGASRAAVYGAAIGTVVGLVLGLPGLILGPFIGALVGELSARRDMMRAGKVAFGTWLGLIVAAVVKLSLVFAMLSIFGFAYFFSGDGLAFA
jgi:uncharacterized protein YqgC (DUF456 family)